MTIKQLFERVEHANNILIPLTNNYIKIIFTSDLRTITRSRERFYKYEDFETFIRTNFKSETDKMLKKNFEEIGTRFCFENKGCIELFIDDISSYL